MFVFADLVVALATCGLGLYVVRRGYLMVQTPTSVGLPGLWRLVIELIRRTRGEAAAMRKEAELVRPERIQRSGRYALVAGSLLLIGGGVQLVGWIGRILGLL